MIPHMLLRELQVPFTEQQMRMKADMSGYEAADGSFTHEDFLKINPSGYVPTISVGGTIITENPAICRYIADLAPERELLGSSPMEQVRVEEWMVWLSGTLHGYGYGAFFRPTRFVGDAEEMHATVRDKGRKTISRCYDKIEDGIQGKYAFGDHLTVVDFMLHTFFRWGRQFGFEVDAKYPRYRELAEEVEKLESVKTAMEEEHQPLLFPNST